MGIQGLLHHWLKIQKKKNVKHFQILPHTKSYLNNSKSINISQLWEDFKLQIIYVISLPNLIISSAPLIFLNYGFFLQITPPNPINLFQCFQDFKLFMQSLLSIPLTPVSYGFNTIYEKLTSWFLSLSIIVRVQKFKLFMQIPLSIPLIYPIPLVYLNHGFLLFTPVMQNLNSQITPLKQEDGEGRAQNGFLGLVYSFASM